MLLHTDAKPRPAMKTRKAETIAAMTGMASAGMGISFDPSKAARRALRLDGDQRE